MYAQRASLIAFFAVAVWSMATPAGELELKLGQVREIVLSPGQAQSLCGFARRRPTVGAAEAQVTTPAPAPVVRLSPGVQAPAPWGRCAVSRGTDLSVGKLSPATARLHLAGPTRYRRGKPPRGGRLSWPALLLGAALF